MDKQVAKFKKYVPNKILVGGLDYKIIYPHQFETDDNTLGKHIPYLCEIRLAGYDTTGTVRPLPRVYCVLLHEIIHAMEKVYATYVFSHPAVCNLSSGWLQVLRDNELFLNVEGKLPKKIKVGGFNYKVKYPYVFTDESGRVYSACRNGITTIFLSGEDIDGKFNDKFLKQNLVFNILAAICSVYIGEYPLYVDNGKKIPFEVQNDALDALSHAFYQVFADNDLERVIKRGIRETR